MNSIENLSPISLSANPTGDNWLVNFFRRKRLTEVEKFRNEMMLSGFDISDFSDDQILESAKLMSNAIDGTCFSACEIAKVLSKMAKL